MKNWWYLRFPKYYLDNSRRIVGNDEVERRWLGRHWQWINISRTKVPTTDSLHRNKKDSLVQKKWGKRESHGCFRVPQLAWLLFDRQTVVDSLHWDPMIALWKQNSAELDSVEYYTKNRGLAKPWLAKQDTIPNPNPYKNAIKKHFQKGAIDWLLLFLLTS